MFHRVTIPDGQREIPRCRFCLPDEKCAGGKALHEQLFLRFCPLDVSEVPFFSFVGLLCSDVCAGNISFLVIEKNNDNKSVKRSMIDADDDKVRKLRPINRNSAISSWYCSHIILKKLVYALRELSTFTGYLHQVWKEKSEKSLRPPFFSRPLMSPRHLSMVPAQVFQYLDPFLSRGSKKVSIVPSLPFSTTPSTIFLLLYPKNNFRLPC